MPLMQRQERPGVVTFVGVVLYILALMALVTSAVYFFGRDDSDLWASTGLDSTELAWAAGLELLISILLFFVASGVMIGQNLARFFVAVVMGFRMMVAMYWLASGTGTQGWFVTILIAVFVLWALYGHAESERFFSGRPAAS